MVEIKRNKRAAIPIIAVFALVVLGFWYFGHLGIIKLVIASAITAPLFLIGYLIMSYAGPKTSKLYGLENFTDRKSVV